MARAELSVRNFLLVYQIRKEPTIPRFTLFGVDYQVLVPADTEFPRTLPTFDFFVRFLVVKPGTAKLRIRVQWDDAPVPTGDVVRYRIDRVFANTGQYQDETIRIPTVRLPGEGRYQVTLSQRAPTKERWRGIRWKKLRTEYLFVGRNS